MERKPRPRSASIMSRPVITTVGLAGLFMSVAIDLVIVFGRDHYDNVAIGSTMGLVAFSLMLVVAAFESRDETGSILRDGDVRQQRREPHDPGGDRSRDLDRTRRRADVAAQHSGSHRPAMADRRRLPAVVLFILWELGKLIARRRAESVQVAVPADAIPAEATAN